MLGGIFGGKAAKNAAKIQAQNAQKVVDLTKGAVTDAQTGVKDATGAGLQSLAAGTAGANDILGSASTNLQSLYNPFIKAGTDSVSSLQSLAGPGGPLSQQFSFDPNDVSNNPGYQFTLKQGHDAIQRAAAAQGNLFSTGTLKSLAGYTAGTANQYENQFYNQALNTFNTNRQGVLSQIGTLQGLAGLGANATGGVASGQTALAGQQAQNLFGGSEFGANLGLQGAATAGGYGLTGADIEGRALTGGANAQAAGTVGSTNSWLSALNNGTNNILQSLAMRPGGGGAGSMSDPYNSSVINSASGPYTGAFNWGR